MERAEPKNEGRACGGAERGVGTEKRAAGGAVREDEEEDEEAEEEEDVWVGWETTGGWSDVAVGRFVWGEI